jgi:phage shock protein PspC (stress-responsive transcriptional regulator)
MERGRNSGTRVRRGPLYGARARLVTPSVEEEPPAREEAEHAVVLALMRRKGMRTSSSSRFFYRRGIGLALGCLVGCDAGLLVGWDGQVSLVRFFFSLFLSIFIFYFPFLFYILF